MTKTLRKFIPRAPRYVLRPNDDRFVRFAYHDERSHTFSTQLLNLSETGLAFIIDRETCPQIGDIIKIEFPIPEAEYVAWFARVARIEEFLDQPKINNLSELEKIELDEKDYVMVGVKFHELPVGHQKAIRSSLNKKFNQILKERYRQNLYELTSGFAAHFWKTLFYFALAITTFAILYYFSLPDSHYDKKRGAPWGQRYPALNFFSPDPDEK